MTEDEQRYVYELQGRIMACENLIKALLVHLAAQLDGADPIGAITKVEKGIVGGMQHTSFSAYDGGEVPPDVQEVVWESAGANVRLMFQNVREKLEAAIRAKP